MKPFIAILGLLVVTPAGIVRRADRADAAYLELGARYPAVVAVGRLGDAALVGDRWLLTAAHIAAALESGRGPTSVRFAGKDYQIARVTRHPEWRELGPHDMGLIELGAPVTGVRPLALYRESNETRKVARLIGHGGSGAGSSRERREDGRARGATSRVDSADASWLYFSFDAPPAGTALEGAPGPGDSGGPALIETGGRVRVAGVSSAGYDGRDGPGTYGAVDVFTRVSRYLPWIDSVMKSPAPARSAAHAPAAPARGDTTQGLPNTPAGRRYSAFITAMNAGTDSAILAFLDGNFHEGQLAARPAQDRLPNFRRLAELLKGAAFDVETSAPLQLTVRFRGGPEPIAIELVLSDEAPHKILDWRRY